MAPTHPILLVIACVIAAPFVLPLLRYFFGRWDQLNENVGIATKQESKVAAFSLFLITCFEPRLWGFLAVLVALVAGSYQALVFLAELLQ